MQVLCYGKASATMKAYWPKLCQLVGWLVPQGDEEDAGSDSGHSPAPEESGTFLLDASKYLEFLYAEEARRSASSKNSFL